MRIARTLLPNYNLNVWLMLANTFFIFVALGIFALVFNLYLASLGMREDYIGLFAFANTAAIGGFAIPAGFLSNRFGPRNCLLVASLLMGLSALAVILIANPVLIVLAGAALGATNALIFVPGGPFLMDNSDEDERLAVFSASFAMNSFASVVGSLGGYLPALFTSTLGTPPGAEAYRATLLVGAVFSFLGAAPMFLVRPTQRRQMARKGKLPVIVPLSESDARRLLVSVAFAVGLLAVGTGLILPFYNVFLAQHLSVPVEDVGLIYAVASLLMVPCSLLGPALSRRFGTVVAVAIPRLLTVPFLLAIAVAPNASLGALVYIARAALMSVTWPIDNSFTMELAPPRMRALVAGIRSGSWNIGWSLASLVAGQVIVSLGYLIVFLASALLTLVGTAYYVLRFRRYAPRLAVGRAEPAEA